MARTIIHTIHAPEAIGTYSQAVKIGDTVYLSGQIPLVPETMLVVEGDFAAQVHRVFENLKYCTSSLLKRQTVPCDERS